MSHGKSPEKVVQEIRRKRRFGLSSRDCGAKRASVIQPDGVVDDVRRKAMPQVAGSTGIHPAIVPRGELT